MKVLNFCIISLLLIGCFSACNRSNESNHFQAGINSFDVSRNDSLIVYVDFDSMSSEKIILAEINGNIIDTIVEGVDDSLKIIFIEPKFSGTGDSILMLGYKKGNLYSNIYLYNRISKEGAWVTNQKKHIITEAIYSLDYSKIYFVSATDYNNYSPLASKAPHGFDLYEYEVKSNKRRKVTDFGAYFMGNISLFDEARLSMRLDYLDTSGLVLLNINNGISIDTFPYIGTYSREGKKYYSRYEYQWFSSNTKDYVVFGKQYWMQAYKHGKIEAKQVFRSKSGGLISLKGLGKSNEVIFIDNDKNLIPSLFRLDIETEKVSEIKFK